MEMFFNNLEDIVSDNSYYFDMYNILKNVETESSGFIDDEHNTLINFQRLVLLKVIDICCNNKIVFKFPELDDYSDFNTAVADKIMTLDSFNVDVIQDIINRQDY